MRNHPATRPDPRPCLLLPGVAFLFPQGGDTADDMRIMAWTGARTEDRIEAAWERLAHPLAELIYAVEERDGIDFDIQAMIRKEIDEAKQAPPRGD
jgi:hypothetical protein